jgi:hypothetical protein
VFFLFTFFISFRFFVVWWVVVVTKYDRTYQGIQSRALQSIISTKLNGNHLLTHKEAFTHEQNMHKRLKLANSFFLSFVYGFLFCTFIFFYSYLWYCWLYIGYWFCFAFICSNLMHLHLALSQHMQFIYLTKKISHQAQVFNVNCPSL